MTKPHADSEPGQPLGLPLNDGLGIPPGWDEDTLGGLLDFVRGEGKFSHMGPGITTHPESTSENQRSIHAAMLELERRNVVKRVPVQALCGSSVTWMPNA